MGNKKNDSAIKYIRTINRCNNQLHYLSSILDKGINLDNVTFFKHSFEYENLYNIKLKIKLTNIYI